MNQLAKDLWRMRWLVFASAFTGILFAPLIVTGYHTVATEWNDWRPVVRMTGTVVDRTNESVTIHVAGEKLRECTYVGMTAYSRGADGLLHDAYRQRIDRPEGQFTRPKGTFDIGFWRIWPLGADAVSVVMFAKHECDGHVVVSKLAEVQL